METENNTPIHKVKVGTIEGVVWEQTNKENNSKFYNITLQRSYKDRDVWKKTQSFRTNDLPDIELVLKEIYKWIKIK